ncbi:fumarylacetoacetate hydrolase family protein [Neobacillus sp. 114]|uniref:fumarylacetoacetate hydrolase family protein n=1 Tax=Neobacillus sp. 114 TaxID=3048535 RepID=UPI0024C3A90D|nr:fumarylacetoacetate hydrolase family protein [Neobacillus sp. 114]
MILLTFYKRELLRLGIKTERGIFDVEAAASKLPHIQSAPKTTAELIAFGPEKLLELLDLSNMEDNLFLDEESLTFGPCVTEPQKIIGVGLNYKDHAAECGLPLPPVPIIFSKFNTAIRAHGEDILLPKNATQVDYEGEIAIIIGKKAKNVKTEEALSVIYGYCITNDLTARDLQKVTGQWLLGKSCDGFCPLGPYLVSKEEVENSNNLRIVTKLNGEVCQDSNTSNMIFSCEELISYLSDHFTLQPGDVILTGTPAGVILGKPEGQQVWLKDGDEISIEIDKLGTLKNKFKSEGYSSSIVE